MGKQAIASACVLVFGLSLLVSNAHGASPGQALQEDASIGKKNDMAEPVTSEEYYSQDSGDDSTNPKNTHARPLDRIKARHGNEREVIKPWNKNSKMISGNAQKKNTSSSSLKNRKKNFRHWERPANSDRDPPYTLDDLRNLKFMSKSEHLESDRDIALNNTHRESLSPTNMNYTESGNQSPMSMNNTESGLPPTYMSGSKIEDLGVMKMISLQKTDSFEPQKKKGDLLDSVANYDDKRASPSHVSSKLKQSDTTYDDYLEDYSQVAEKSKTPVPTFPKTKMSSKKRKKGKKKNKNAYNLSLESAHPLNVNSRNPPWNATGLHAPIHIAEEPEGLQRQESHYSSARSMKIQPHNVMSATSFLVVFVSSYRKN